VAVVLITIQRRPLLYSSLLGLKICSNSFFLLFPISTGLFSGDMVTLYIVPFNRWLWTSRSSCFDWARLSCILQLFYRVCAQIYTNWLRNAKIAAFCSIYCRLFDWLVLKPIKQRKKYTYPITPNQLKNQNLTHFCRFLAAISRQFRGANSFFPFFRFPNPDFSTISNQKKTFCANTLC